MSLFRGNQVATMAELRICSAKLEGLPPFPTWNGTIAAPLEDARGLCSTLGADGELVVLQNDRSDDDNHSWLRILKVLPPAVEKFSSFCQCWTNDGAMIVTAHDCSVVLYNSNDFKVLAKLQLQYTVASMDITKRSQTATRKSDASEILLIVGSAFGCFLYKVLLSNARGTGDTAELKPVARVQDGVAVCLVKFSSDGHYAAMGTMDGRLFLRRLDSHEDDVLATFGTCVLTRVLKAPRVTSMCFSACSTKLVVATRKGNVYVFVCASESGEWQMLPSCKHLSENPKPKAGSAAGVNKVATAAQTLVACWGPVLVVCSRAVASRVEMYDFESGYLLHSLQLASTPANAALNEWVDLQLVTGVFSVQLASASGYSSRLLCHDTSANVVVVEWSFLDVIAQRRSTVELTLEGFDKLQ
ncbi:hypothetical protein PPTG_01256 [Phytophthora nicotianae INRA-310]|uniref:Anaphase-promoting complex subunit 4 WD40 domain-containing protein n=1 Tax=Phytophthora nicotianae (strain INRA-310) TaxID=761204 RepID=W2R660_PHYN3|nr:hypothetical protein PPTG_01256 [Phytophthora nicotianae INRA-310]ETN20883.1 hypothetical protein PPTG_01256 [Phytophthora nicotianae INRA-310]